IYCGCIVFSFPTCVLYHPLPCTYPTYVIHPHPQTKGTFSNFLMNPSNINPNAARNILRTVPFIAQAPPEQFQVLFTSGSMSSEREQIEAAKQEWEGKLKGKKFSSSDVGAESTV